MNDKVELVSLIPSRNMNEYTVVMVFVSSILTLQQIYKQNTIHIG